MNADVNLMVENSIQTKTRKMIIVTVSTKKPIIHRLGEEDYPWNPNMCACKCDKDCGSEYLKYCTCNKNLVDDIETCNEIANTPETTPIISYGKTNHWLIAIILLAITCLLLLAVIVVKYYMKHE